MIQKCVASFINKLNFVVAVIRTFSTVTSQQEKILGLSQLGPFQFNSIQLVTIRFYSIRFASIRFDSLQFNLIQFN